MAKNTTTVSTTVLVRILSYARFQFLIQTGALGYPYFHAYKRIDDLSVTR